MDGKPVADSLARCPGFVVVEIRGGSAETFCPFFRLDAAWTRVLDLVGEGRAGLEPVALGSAPDAIEDRWDFAKGGVDE